MRRHVIDSRQAILHKVYISPVMKVKLMEPTGLMDDMDSTHNQMGNGNQLSKEDIFYEDDQLIHAPQVKSIWDE